MLLLRRILAAVCYIAMIAADAVSVYVIYISIYGRITYYFGLLIFLPIFIFSYWMATFFSQLTSGRVNGKKIIPKWLRTLLNTVGNLISLALVAFWGYIYINQTLYAAPNESLAAEVKNFILLN